MEKKTIWIMNHHADTNGHRHYELAREFAGMGYQVTVFASSFHHMQHAFTRQEEFVVESIEENVLFVWLKTTPAYSNNGMKRILNMLSYLRLIKKYVPRLWREYAPPQFVIGSSVHPLAWEAAFWTAKKCGAEFICEVRDFWPLSLTEISGLKQYHPVVLFFSLIEQRAYRRAVKIITTFPYGYQYICSKFGIPQSKVFWIPNGIRVERDAEEAPVLPSDLESYLRLHWCCIYTGSLVQSECVDFMIEAFRELKNEDIYFAIVGSGHETDQLTKLLKEYDIQKAQIFPRIEKKQVTTVLHLAKCCLAALHNHPIYRYGLSMNKLNDYLCSGTPIVFACNAPNVIQETGNITMPYGDAQQYARAILKIRNMNNAEKDSIAKSGMDVIQKTYDYRIIAQKYINAIDYSS